MRRLAESPDTILLAVEDREARAQIADSLQAHGYVVLVAMDTLDALQISNTHGKPIELLLTDLLVPGTSGHELTEVLNLKRPLMKAVYLGHATDPSEPGRLLDSQAVYLGEPFTVKPVLRRVRKVLSASARAKSAVHVNSRHRAA